MKQDEKTLSGILAEYAAGEVYPMHMPGHKRRGAAVDKALPWGMDLTEIYGFDDLHEPEGILKEVEDRAAQLYKTRKSWMLVNGSTCGILAAIGAAAKPGDAIIVARNCHKAVYHALELLRLKPVYLAPAQAEGVPFCGAVAAQTVKAALQAHPEAKAVILTSPTYEGILSDIPAIARHCREYDVPLIVDEAHGAHLAFGEAFPKSAVEQGADLVIQSLHKTLPALTQTALLHNCTGRIADAAISHQLDIFETSSPSYLLMASVDSCLRYMESRGREEMERYRERLEEFAKKSAEWKNLRLFTRESLAAASGFCPEMDSGKLVIGCRGRGPELAEKLRREHKIELEMTQPDHVLAMTSLMDTQEGFDRLARALSALDGQLEEAPREEAGFVPPAVPGQVLPIDRALGGERETVPWAKALGRVSAGYLWAYPPGIPWLAPGERIGEDCLKAAEAAARAGISLIKTWDAPEGEISVLKEPVEP